MFMFCTSQDSGSADEHCTIYICVIFDVHCGLLNIIDDYNSLISQIILLNV